MTLQFKLERQRRTRV